MIHYQLQNEKALVCGGSRGIGLGIAQKLASSGASVCLLARDEGTLQEAVYSLAKSPEQEHTYVSCDMRNLDSIRTAGEKALAFAGRFSLLINNSEGPQAGPLQDAQEVALVQAFNQHILSAHRLLQMLLPGMQELGRGRIINVISTSVKQPIANLGVSNTIRGAMANWAKTLASELGPLGITVNNLLPGSITTRRLDALFAAKAAKTGQGLEEVRAGAIAEIPLRRFGSPSEIGDVVAFLCSEGGGYINGTNIVVDGGRTSCL